MMTKTCLDYRMENVSPALLAHKFIYETREKQFVSFQLKWNAD